MTSPNISSPQNGRIKISDLVEEINQKISDPSTKTRVIRQMIFYEIRTFPRDDRPGAARCAGIIRTIIGYNVKMLATSTQIRVMASPGMQKKPIVSSVSP